MKITKIEIEQEQFGKDKGKYKGLISLKNDKPYTFVNLSIPPDVATKIMKLCVPIFESCTNEGIQLLKEELKNSIKETKTK